MKKIVLIFLCFVCGWSALHAKDEYIVEMYGGSVKYKNENSNDWRTVYNNLILFTNDLICVEKGGYVTIGYRNTPYKFSSPCASKIYDLVSEKRKEQSMQFTLKSFLQEIRANRGEVSRFQMRQSGIGKSRGGDDSDTIYRDTIDYIQLAKTLAKVGSIAFTEKESPQIKGITFNKIITNEGLSFEYSNSSGQDYYINVLHVNKRAKKISLCYVIMDNVKEQACPITPNGFISCNRGIYFPSTPDDVYILIALNYPYDSDKLDNWLTRYTIDASGKINSSIKYMW